MWEWTGPAELAWLAWAGWWGYRQWRSPAPVVGTPPAFRSAMLLNASGTLDAAGDTANIQVNNGTPDSAATSGTAPNTSAAEFRIGAREYAGFEGYFDGLIDQVGIWKRVLTAQERTDLYNAGAGLSYADMSGGAAATPVRIRRSALLGVG